MQHPLRRKKQALSLEEVEAILNHETYGVLAISHEEAPYAVPLNYVYVPADDPEYEGSVGTFYFHCAKKGHKLEVLKENPRASFCVVGRHDVLPDEFATAYKSVIAFGKVSILNGAEAHDELYKLADKFNPGAHAAIENEISSDGPHCLVLKLDVAHMTGKQALSFLS